MIDADNIIPVVAIVVAVGGPLLLVLGLIVTKAIERVTKTRELVDLKHRMLDDGYSPEEIAMVVSAGEPLSRREQRKQTRHGVLGKTRELISAHIDEALERNRAEVEARRAKTRRKYPQLADDDTEARA